MTLYVAVCFFLNGYNRARCLIREETGYDGEIYQDRNPGPYVNYSDEGQIVSLRNRDRTEGRVVSLRHERILRQNRQSEGTFQVSFKSQLLMNFETHKV
jgi:hypothetical protein